MQDAGAASLHGRSSDFWWKLLLDQELPHKMLALRVLGESAVSPTAAWHQVPADLPFWTRVWYAERSLSGHPARPVPGSPEEIAAALQLEPGAEEALLDELASQLQAEWHPLQRVSLMQQLLAHGERSAPVWLRLLRTPLHNPDRWHQLAELAAYALGRLERDAWLPIREAWPHAPYAVRDALCQVIWYLGPHRVGPTVAALIGGHESVWTEVALQALQGLGSGALLSRRAAPLWIDKQTLPGLAELAFSLRDEDRSYAVGALQGWGPELGQGIHLLLMMVEVHSREGGEAAVELSREAGLALNRLGANWPRPLLESALAAPWPDIQDAAYAGWQRAGGGGPLELWEEFRSHRDIRVRAFCMLRGLKLSAAECERLDVLLSDLNDSELCVLVGNNWLGRLTPVLQQRMVAMLQSGPASAQAWVLENLPQCTFVEPLDALARAVRELADRADRELADKAASLVFARGSVECFRPLLEGAGRLLPHRLWLLERAWCGGRLPQDAEAPALLSLLEPLLEHDDLQVQESAEWLWLDLSLAEGRMDDVLQRQPGTLVNEETAAPVLRWLRERRCFPRRLRRSMESGFDVSFLTLRLAAELLAGAERFELLFASFVRAPRARRPEYVGVLRRLGKTGWKLLQEWLKHPEEHVQRDAAELVGSLSEEPAGWEQLGRLGPELLNLPTLPFGPRGAGWSRASLLGHAAGQGAADASLD